jgi:hypothetical protein
MNQHKDNSLNLATAGILILLAAACRLLPHPMNFTPVLAVALFGGATLPRRLALAVPLGAMVLSDLALGYGFGTMNLVVYACFLAAVGLGWWLREKRTPGRTLGAALAGSLLFFVVTNFWVWLGPMMPPPYDYPPTFAGLVKCYVMALPFLRNSLAGDVCWTLGLFTLYDLARAWAARRRTAPGGRLAA